MWLRYRAPALPRDRTRDFASSPPIRSKELLQQALHVSELRSESADVFQKIAGLYYLGRLHMKHKLDINKSIRYLTLAQDLFQKHRAQFDNVVTLQYQIFKQKIDRQLQQFQLARAVTNQMEKLDLAKSQSLESEQKQCAEQKQRAEQPLRQGAAEADCARSQVEKYQLNKQYQFFDSGQVKLVEFSGKTRFGNRYLGFLVSAQEQSAPSLLSGNNLLQNIYLLNKLRFSEGEAAMKGMVWVVTFQFLRNDYFARIFQQFKRVSQVPRIPGLARSIGFAIDQLDTHAFTLMVLYAKPEFSLYEVCLVAHMPKFSDKLSLALQLAETVNQMHENDLFHGNLYPGNVYFDRNKQVQLMDWEFGGAPAEDDDIANVQEQDSDLALGYAAPECYHLALARRTLSRPDTKPTQVNRLCDIWSLGMILNLLFLGTDARSSGYCKQKGIYEG